MAVKRKKSDFKAWAAAAARAADDKKARVVEAFDIRKDSDVVDYVVIAEADSTAQLRALESAVEDSLREAGARLLHRDSRPTNRWRALDYGGVIVHLMMAEARAFYRLEHLWEKAKPLAW